MDSTKKSAGLSYIEVIIALAIFTVTLTVVFATISQATRNLYAAQVYYDAHRHATSIMMAFRDAANAGESAEAAALETAARFGVQHFTVWVDGEYVMGVQWGSVSVSESIAPSVVVVVWSADERIIGRAVTLI